MELQLLSTPARNLSLNNVSNWVAAYNPIVFTYQIKDFEINQIVDIGDGYFSGKLTVLLTDDVKTRLLNTRVFINTASGFNDSVVITSFGSAGGVTIFSFTYFGDSAITAGATTGFMYSPNLYLSSRVVTVIEFKDKTTITMTNSANPNGLFTVDVSAYIKSYVKNIDAIDYNILNSLDKSAFVKFSVSYDIYYTLFNVDETHEGIETAGDFWAVNAALQFGPYGSNLAPYVPFLVEPNSNKLAKFLTEIKEPNIYPDRPVDVSFILSENFTGKTLRVKYTTLDVNKNPVANGLSPDFLLTGLGSLLLINIVDGLLVNEAAYTAALPAQSVGVNRLVLVTSFLPIVKYLQVNLYYVDGSGNEISVTENKTFKVNCSQPGAYVKWLNPLGGWDYALFTYRVGSALSVTGAFIDRTVYDYETQRETQDVLNKTATPSIIVGKDQISAEEVDKLKGLYFSPKVYLLVVENPYTWHGVTIDTKGGDLYDSRDKRGDFEVELLLPTLNIQTA